MKRPPRMISDRIAEWWVLKVYFDTRDKKRLGRLRDEFIKDMQINFVSGKVTKATNLFDPFKNNDRAFNEFKQTNMMLELQKEAFSREEKNMSEIFKLLKSLRFMN